MRFEPVTGYMGSIKLFGFKKVVRLIKIKTRYSSRIAPIHDALVLLAGCKAYENKP